MTGLFKLRGTLDEKTRVAIEITGVVATLVVWTALVAWKLVPATILPMPWKVLTSLKELHYQDALIVNAMYSIKINFLGYLEAVGLALPLGMAIGLLPVCRALSERLIGAARYLPLTATIGIFIALFGIETKMKVEFLAFGIFVYLLPVVVERVDEVQEVYVQTAQTLGATPWQTVKSVFIPDVVSRVFDDIRVLIALSWTYIVFTEVINASDGGIGALAYIAARQSRPDKVYAVLLTIILIGFLQDKAFVSLGKFLFPFKYAEGGGSGRSFA